MEPSGAPYVLIIAEQRYVEQLMKLIGDQTAFFVFGLLMLAVAAVTSLWSTKARLVILSLTLYMSTLQRQKATPWYSLELAPGLQTLSDYSRILTVGLLVILSITALFTKSGARQRILSAPLLAFLLFEYLNCVKIATGGDTVLAVTSVLTFTLIFLGVPVMAGKVIQELSDTRGILLVILGASVLVTIGTMYQFTIRPGAVFAGAHPRLYATLGHPQKAGLLYALVIPIAMYLTVFWRRFTWAKPLFIGLAALSIVGVAASGSRTALIAAVVGCGVLYRHRLSLGVLATVVIFFAGFAILERVAGFHEASQRLFITTNTRTNAWSEMYAQFAQNPVFGADYTGSGTGESSFLGAAARMGIIGVIAVTILTLLIALLIFRLNRARKHLGAEASLADLVIGGLAAMGVGCVFDQYLFDTITFFNMFLYLYLAMGAAILELSHREELRKMAPQPYVVDLRSG